MALLSCSPAGWRDILICDRELLYEGLSPIQETKPDSIFTLGNMFKNITINFKWGYLFFALNRQKKEPGNDPWNK